ncbi:MAG TPA: thioesterase family protein [Vicinamibacterales bacterium]
MFRYKRRVEFAETDMAGIVHFSMFFRYMEEAEHALWRAAGLTIATPGETIGWPRVSAAFDYKAPLRFQDEFEVTVEIARVARRTIDYAFTIVHEGRTIGSGSLTTACVSKNPGEPMKSIGLPPDVVSKLRAAADV